MTTQTLSTNARLENENRQTTLRPLGAAASLAYFGLPAAFAFVSFWLFRPWLERIGYDAFTSYLASLCVPVALLFAAALITYNKVEGRPLTWAAFAERMRFPRLGWRDLLWALVIFVGGLGGMFLLSALVVALIRAGWMPIPANLPGVVDPLAEMTLETLAQSAGGVIRGRWDIAALYLVTFFFNIVGEELWWRGFILPRQELAFGRRTWLVHGTLWALFHIFKWWDVLTLLPVCLLESLSATRTRSTWGALIGHALVNGTSMLVILWVIAG